MNKLSRFGGKWAANVLIFGVVLGGMAVAIPRGARADEIDDQLKK